MLGVKNGHSNGYDKIHLRLLKDETDKATSRKLFNKREMLKLMRTLEWIEIYALVTLHCAIEIACVWAIYREKKVPSSSKAIEESRG